MFKWIGLSNTHTEIQVNIHKSLGYFCAQIATNIYKCDKPWLLPCPDPANIHKSLDFFPALFISSLTSRARNNGCQGQAGEALLYGRSSQNSSARESLMTRQGYGATWGSRQRVWRHIKKIKLTRFLNVHFISFIIIAAIAFRVTFGSCK